MLRLDQFDHMYRSDMFTSLAYNFYASTIAWLDYLPDIYWAVIIFNLLYPFVVHKQGKFGWPMVWGWGRLLTTKNSSQGG